MSSPSATGHPLPGRLVVRSVELPAAGAVPDNLLDLLPADRPAVWLRRGEGLVAWGTAAECTTSGPDRFTDAVDWWRSV